MNRIHREWITTMNMHEQYINGKTLEQIGNTYGCTKNAVSQRFKRVNLCIRPQSVTNKLSMTPDRRKKASERMIGNIPWNKGLTKEMDKRVLKNSIGVSKGLKGNVPWNKNKIGLQNSIFKGKKRNKDFCKKVSIGLNKFWKSSKSNDLREKYRYNTIKKIQNGEFPQVNTSIEQKMKKYLNREHIQFSHSYNFNNKFCCDFAIPDKKIIIECDGDYWHNREDVKKRDKAKNTYIKKCGWKMLRFWEHEINNDIDKCLIKIKKEISDY